MRTNPQPDPDPQPDPSPHPRPHPRPQPQLRLLRAAAAAEPVTLAALFANLATYHWPTVAALLGPLHGCAYLYVALAVARAPGASVRTRLLALVPAVGGLIALRRLPPPPPAAA